MSSSGVCHNAPTTTTDIRRVQPAPMAKVMTRAEFPRTGYSAIHMANAVAQTAVTCPEGKLSAPRNLSWTSGLTTCSLTSSAMTANAAPATTRRSTPFRAPKTRQARTTAPMTGVPEEVGDLAPAIDGRGTFEHAKCVLLQAVRAVTA